MGTTQSAPTPQRAPQTPSVCTAGTAVDPDVYHAGLVGNAAAIEALPESRPAPAWFDPICDGDAPDDAAFGEATPMWALPVEGASSATDPSGTQGSAQGKASAGQLTDGGRATGSASGKVSAKSDDVGFEGSLALSGGLVARARATRLPEGLVRVDVRVEASGGGQLSAAVKGDAGSGGFQAGLGGAVRVEASRTLTESELPSLQAAWAAGDVDRVTGAFASLASVRDHGAGLGEVDPSTVGVGERRLIETSTDGALCVPVSLGAVSGSYGGAVAGRHVREVSHDANGLLRVRVGFETTATRSADGRLTLGLADATAGGSTAHTVGLEVSFLLGARTEAEVARAVLDVTAVDALERLAARHAAAVTSRTVIDRATETDRHGLARGGLSVGWDATEERSEAIRTGDGLDGTSVSGSRTDGFGVSHGGKPVLGGSDRTALDAKVTGEGMTASLRHTETSTGLGLGLPALASVAGGDWPAAFRSAFVHSRETLYAVQLSDAEIREILCVRAFRVADWDCCARTVGTHARWRLTGASIRRAVPDPAWVAADADMALLVARMRPLADYVAEVDGADEVLVNLTTRFGERPDSGEGELAPRLGVRDDWPAGAEAAKARWDAVVPALATWEADADALVAVGDLTGARALFLALRMGLQGVAESVTRSETEVRWRVQRLENVDRLRAEVEWGYAHMEQEIGVCDPENPDADVDASYLDGRRRELWVLATTMHRYQAIEAETLARYEGSTDIKGLTAFGVAMGDVYSGWWAACRRFQRIGAPLGTRLSAVPDLAGLARVYSSLMPTATAGASARDCFPLAFQIVESA